MRAFSELGVYVLCLLVVSFLYQHGDVEPTTTARTTAFSNCCSYLARICEHKHVCRLFLETVLGGGLEKIRFFLHLQVIRSGKVRSCEVVDNSNG